MIAGVRVLVFVMLAAATAYAADPQPPPGATAKVDRIVATVDGTPIWWSELQDRVAPTGDSSDKMQHAILDEMIDEQVIVAKAIAARIDVDDSEVDAAMEEIKKQNGLDDAGLDQALTAQHYTRARYRIELKRQLLRLRAVNQLVSPSIVAKDADERRKKLDAATTTWVAKLRAGAHVEIKL
jgi:peptidyl-prolyl cis-trans isomerase SurA